MPDLRATVSRSVRGAGVWAAAAVLAVVLAAGPTPAAQAGGCSSRSGWSVSVSLGSGYGYRSRCSPVYRHHHRHHRHYSHGHCRSWDRGYRCGYRGWYGYRRSHCWTRARYTYNRCSWPSRRVWYSYDSDCGSRVGATIVLGDAGLTGSSPVVGGRALVESQPRTDVVDRRVVAAASRNSAADWRSWQSAARAERAALAAAEAAEREPVEIVEYPTEIEAAELEREPVGSVRAASGARRPLPPGVDGPGGEEAGAGESALAEAEGDAEPAEDDAAEASG